MFKKMSVSLVGLAILSANAQTVNLQGVVSNSTGKPIEKAIVTLVRQKMKDTTDVDGKFSFIATPTKKTSRILPQANNISLNNNVLQFALSAPSPMKVQIFNLKGNLLSQEINQNAAAGTYRFDISKHHQAANVLLIKAAIGKSEVSFRYIPFNGERYALSIPNTASPISSNNRFAAIGDVVDTLTVTATGYKTKSIAITSLDDQQQNIALDTNNGKNDPGPSIGCGKTLGSINKSGRYTVTSAGMSRSYIIDIPANYDKDKPYRLIFGMHCMGGSSDKVSSASNDETAYFYHLKPLAEKDNIQCIFVAPQGENSGMWLQQEKDHTFFSDMLKLFKDNLCIDTTRVFSCGFSFGAMFTFSLSTSFQKELRAVACYAPANYNIWLPTNKHLPIAYMQTTGTSDPTCPWINQGGQNQGGKYCLQSHAEDNGCTIPANIPLANSGKHVTTEFEGCQDGYPVKFCSFQGGHVCNMNESNVNWIPVETWEFFMRF